MFVLAVGVLALVSVATGSLSSLSRSEARQDAYTAATRSIELIRTYEWNQVALDPDEGLVADLLGGFDPIEGTVSDPGASNTDAEVVVTSVNGLVAGMPHQFDDGRLNLRTVVTSYFDDPDNPDAEQRRITVVVEFTEGGRTEVVRQSTLVTRANWGIGQPQFSVSPISVRILVERHRETCIDHEVTNLGQQDRYRFDVPGTTLLPGGFGHIVFREIHIDDGSEKASWLPALTPDQYTDHYVTSDTLSEARFIAQFCYTLDGDASADNPLVDGPLAIVPESVPDRFQTLLHTVELEEERTLYLRSGGANSWTTSTVYEFMTDPSEVDSLADFDGDGLDGLTLPIGSGTARWAVTFERPRIPQTADLVVYAAANDDGDWSSANGLVYDVELVVIPTSGSERTLFAGLMTTGSGSEGGYDDGDLTFGSTASADGEFIRQTWSGLDLDTSADIGSGNRLELRIRCDGDRDPVVIPAQFDELGNEIQPEQLIPRDCVFAFDAEDFLANLHLVLP